MPDHVRKQIRSAAIVLATGLAATGARVFDSRAVALNESNLPCWIVRTEDEEIAVDDTTLGATKNEHRTIELCFEGMAREASGASVQDDLDEMVKELEVAIAADYTLGGLVKDSHLMNIEIDTDDSGDRVFGAVRVVYSVNYWTARGAPDVSL